MEQGIFAAGCFWGVQYYFDQIPGVTQTTAGYTGGTTEDPTYDEVCAPFYGGPSTGHAEAVLVEYDAGKIGYDTLCRHFFRLHDPTQLNRQGPDTGDQYRSAIFYLNESQKEVAERIRDDSQKDHKQPIVTEITAAGPFYEAEDYHQKYTERTGYGACHVPYQAL